MISRFYPTYPVSPLLKEHIYCYYTLKSNDINFYSTHFSFPHTFNAVTLYQGVNISNADSRLTITGNGADNTVCILQGKRQAPLLVSMKGIFSRITILFKPLGLNHFIDHELGKILRADPCLFNAWDTPAELFDSDSTDQIQILEEILIGYYRPFSQPALQQALSLLADLSSEKSIEEIALEAGLSLRTFNRLFKLHLGVTPVTHQRIYRFRHSLENKLFDERDKTMSEITHRSNFYDQSYLIKSYRQFTGSNPGDLFCKLTQMGDSRLVFEFKNL